MPRFVLLSVLLLSTAILAAADSEEKCSNTFSDLSQFRDLDSSIQEELNGIANDLELSKNQKKDRLKALLGTSVGLKKEVLEIVIRRYEMSKEKLLEGLRKYFAPLPQTHLATAEAIIEVTFDMPDHKTKDVHDKVREDYAKSSAEFKAAIKDNVNFAKTFRVDLCIGKL